MPSTPSHRPVRIIAGWAAAVLASAAVVLTGSAPAAAAQQAASQGAGWLAAAQLGAGRLAAAQLGAGRLAAAPSGTGRPVAAQPGAAPGTAAAAGTATAAGKPTAPGTITAPAPSAAPPPAAQPPPGAGTGTQCAPAATAVARPVPWAQQRLQPALAWPLTRGAGVTVAVIDSGVDGTVPQLAGHVLPGIDVLDRGAPANTDCVGHGTFVAGIIAAQVVPGVGFAGVAPDAQILPIRQYDANGTGTPDGLAAAINAAVGAGAAVIDVASSAYPDTPALRQAVATAERRDVLVVAPVADQTTAAATQGGPAVYPGAYPGVVSVGSIGQGGSQSTLGATGGSGPSADLVAPGEQIISLGRGGPGHLEGSGASFAAPFVAGVAALVRSYRPNLTAAQVRHRLEVTADHPGTALPDPQLGYGVVNLYAAVATVLPAEGGAVPGPAPLPRVTIPTATPHVVPGRAIGLMVAAGALALVLLAGLAAIVLPRGQARRWRPGGSEVPGSAPGAPARSGEPVTKG